MIDKEINEMKVCTGCSACAGVCSVNCIAMEGDGEGFLYPKVEENKCLGCGDCIQVCPVLNRVEVKNSPRAFAAVNKDEKIRLGSSSGGVFTLLAEEMIAQGGVVFGAAFNDSCAVEHGYVEDERGIGQFRGSKYVQSAIGASFKQAGELLDQGRKVLFSGTPCQIGGLLAYLGLPRDNLFCADIICHGVPSPAVWNKYVVFREEQAGSAPRRISFRQKNEGWKRFSVSFLFENDTEYRQTLGQDLYMQAFLKDVCLRPSCYDCRFKTLHRQSDITLADFWGIQNVLPEMDDDIGTSLIFVNSGSGQEMFERVKDRLEWQEVDMGVAVKYNPAAVRSAPEHPGRAAFFAELDKLPFDRLVKKCCTDRLPVRLKRKARSALRTALQKTGLLAAVRRTLKG